MNRSGDPFNDDADVIKGRDYLINHDAELIRARDYLHLKRGYLKVSLKCDISKSVRMNINY